VACSKCLYSETILDDKSGDAEDETSAPSGTDNPAFVADEQEDATGSHGNQVLTMADVHDDREAPPGVLVDLEVSKTAGQGESTVMEDQPGEGSVEQGRKYIYMS
jgi:hypothetical protein